MAVTLRAPVDPMSVFTLAYASCSAANEAWYHILFAGRRISVYVHTIRMCPAQYANANHWLPGLLSPYSDRKDNHFVLGKMFEYCTREPHFYPSQSCQDIWHPTLIDLRALTDLERLDDYDFTAIYCPIPPMSVDTFYGDTRRQLNGPVLDTPKPIPKPSTTSGPKIRVRIAMGNIGIAGIRNETYLHSLPHLRRLSVVPSFLGHVHERGQVIGIATEYFENARQPSSHEDFRRCWQALMELHNAGFSHGAIDPKAFLIQETEKAKMVYFNNLSQARQSDFDSDFMRLDKEAFQRMVAGVQCASMQPPQPPPAQQACACWVSPPQPTREQSPSRHFSLPA